MAGQANVYDLTRADEPTQEGTPLNKASLLTDAVATAFGLGGSAVPNDALDILKKAVLAQVTGKYTKHTTIGELPVGKTVTFNVAGVATEFRALHKGRPSSIYDVSCDGVWMAPKDAYAAHKWHTGDEAMYATSAIQTYINDDLLSALDSGVQSAIKQVKIPYVDHGGSGGTIHAGADGLSCKCFLLCGKELGSPSSDFRDIGAKLDYYGTEITDPSRIVNSGGVARNWWTRDVSATYGNNAYYVTTTGAHNMDRVTNDYYVVFSFILPYDFEYTWYSDEDGNIYTEQEYQTILTDVLGNEITAGAQVEVGSYVGTGTYGESNPNTLTFGFEPKALLIQRVSMSGTGTVPFLAVWVSGASELIARNTANFFASTALSTGLAVSWYIASNANAQMNSTGLSYVYVAIG